MKQSEYMRAMILKSSRWIPGRYVKGRNINFQLTDYAGHVSNQMTWRCGAQGLIWKATIFILRSTKQSIERLMRVLILGEAL